MADSSGQPFTALDIAAAFLRQYYNVLNQNADELFRFYAADGVFSHGVQGEPIDSVSGTAERSFLYCHTTVTNAPVALKHKLEELNWLGCTAQLDVIDSNFTLNGAVLILTIGTFTSAAGDTVRKFVQQFLLTAGQGTPGDETLFIRNHSFLYLTGESSRGSGEGPKGEVAATASQNGEVPAGESRAEDAAVKVNGTVRDVAEEESTRGAQVPSENGLANQHVSAVPDPTAAKEGAGAKPKWTDLFANTGTESPAAKPAAPLSATAGGGKRGVGKEGEKAGAARRKAGRGGGGSGGSAGSAGSSERVSTIWVKDVPAEASAQQVRGVFGKYGTITSVNVNKGGFAFVEFKTPQQAESAVKGCKDNARHALRTVDVQYKLESLTANEQVAMGGKVLTVEMRRGGGAGGGRRRRGQRS